MRKIFINGFIVCFFIFTFSLSSGGQLKGEGAHTFYFFDESSNSKIITLSQTKANNFIYFKKNLTGESVIFYNKEKVEFLLNDLNARLIFTESGENFNCEYYFSPKIKNHITLNGNKINLHVCYQKDCVFVGTPLIFGSF